MLPQTPFKGNEVLVCSLNQRFNILVMPPVRLFCSPIKNFSGAKLQRDITAPEFPDSKKLTTK
jgi:hypothetical protein